MWLTSLRQAVVTLLTGLTTTGSRVFTQEPYALHLMPCLLVSTSAPAIEPVTVSSPLQFQVDAEVRIDIVATSLSDLQTIHDTIAGEVIAALANGVTLASIPRTMLLSSIDPVDIDGSGERPVGRRSMSFSCGPLFITANAPTVLN